MARQPRPEDARRKRAFELYYGLGVGRTYPAVAKEIGVALATVKRWGRVYGWQGRVRERDLEVARSAADRSFQGEVESRARQIQIVGMGLLQVAKAIAEGKVRVTMGDLDRLIRLQRFLSNEPDSRTEHVIGDLSGRSREELQTMLREEMKTLRRLGFSAAKAKGGRPRGACSRKGQEVKKKA